MTANKQLYFVFDKQWHKRGCAKKSHKQPVQNRNHLFDFAHTNNKATTCDAIVIIYSLMHEIYFVVIRVAYRRTNGECTTKDSYEIGYRRKKPDRSATFHVALKKSDLHLIFYALNGTHSIRTHFCNWCERILHFFFLSRPQSWKMCSPSTQFDLNAAHKVTLNRRHVALMW